MVRGLGRPNYDDVWSARGQGFVFRSEHYSRVSVSSSWDDVWSIEVRGSSSDRSTIVE